MNADAIRILTVQRDGDDGVIVSFSDGTTGAYVVEELLDLRPKREPTRSAEKEPLMATSKLASPS
jgi:hypothetical protein